MDEEEGVGGGGGFDGTKVVLADNSYNINVHVIGQGVDENPC